MWKSDSIKFALQLNYNHTYAWVFAFKFATYFKNAFL